MGFPCSRVHDLLLDRHAFSLSESHNPKHSTGIHSRSMSFSFPMVPCGSFKSNCPLPSSVIGRGQILRPSKQPTSRQTQLPWGSSLSLQRIRLLLSRHQARQYWPCVRVYSLMRCCHVSLLSCKDRWCGSGRFKATFLGRIFTSSRTELDRPALWKDSVGMLWYSLVGFVI